MQLPEYVTRDEVKRVCRELNIRDWTALDNTAVLMDDARAILAELDVGGMKVDPEEFRRGLEVELEHGTMFAAANVTNNHPILTGKIVLAHFKESLDYYRRLDVAELEGDLLKALVAGKQEKLAALYKRLIAARQAVSKTESEQTVGL
ncbi:MAG: hypothetical protein OEW00_02810 [candidate division Zixibacteria bacterium]|nr:hypothetical protein [candidate division Zixibacteria bacterium]